MTVTMTMEEYTAFSEKVKLADKLQNEVKFWQEQSEMNNKQRLKYMEDYVRLTTFICDSMGVTAKDAFEIAAGKKDFLSLPYKSFKSWKLEENEAPEDFSDNEETYLVCIHSGTYKDLEQYVQEDKFALAYYSGGKWYDSQNGLELVGIYAWASASDFMIEG